MRRWRWWILGGGAMALLLGMFGCNAVATHRGIMAAKRTPEALSALLAPSYRVAMPEGAGPFPVALLFSGCDGPKDNLDRLSEALVEAGWGAVIVDSHGPRGIDRAEVWRLVCSGVTLPGAERAADVAVAIADVRAMERVDGERIALVGASHGGWAVLDLFALARRDEVPWGLTDWPGEVPRPRWTVWCRRSCIIPIAGSGHWSGGTGGRWMFRC